MTAPDDRDDNDRLSDWFFVIVGHSLGAFLGRLLVVMIIVSVVLSMVGLGGDPCDDVAAQYVPGSGC